MTARPEEACCTDEEADYLCAARLGIFPRGRSRANDIVWRFSGVRPLFDDGSKSATAATRDYVLRLDAADGEAPLLNVFGGKITTYRRLAEAALGKLAPFFPQASGAWTAGAPLPGGDFAPDGFDAQVAALHRDFSFLRPEQARRLVRAYGTQAWTLLSGSRQAGDLGRDFGAGLTEREVAWLIDREWAMTAEDVLWRRGKLGLRLGADETEALAGWIAERTGNASRQVQGTDPAD